jgi:hypothetical protein
MELCRCADFLHPFIWSHVSGLMQYRKGSNKRTTKRIKFCAAVHPSCPELSLVTRAGFTVMTLRQKATVLPMEKSELNDTKQGETGEEQSEETFSLTSKELFRAGQTVKMC